MFIQNKIAIIFIILPLFSFGQMKKSKKVISEISFEYMKGCETGAGDCQPVIIERLAPRDEVILILPGGESQADAYLYTDSTFNKWIENPGNEPASIRDDHTTSAENRKLIFNLTGLPDGTYVPHVLSDAVGGTFKLILKTREKQELAN